MDYSKVSTTTPLLNKDGLLAHRLYDHPEAQIIHMSLEPLSVVKPHTTPVNVAFYILSGVVEIEIGDERKHFSANTLVESPKDIPHAIYNNGDEIATLLVMKLPKP